MIRQNEDPRGRLRGVHNWTDFHDHSRSWITHVSMQTVDFPKALEWRRQHRKPRLFGDMRYEGDTSAAWGNLNTEDMSGYFWMTG